MCRNKHSQVNGLGAADDFWYSSMRRPPQAHSLERPNKSQQMQQKLTSVSQTQPFPR
jgi:hypothetical protein